jgi:protein-tyrosine-phosphatase
MAEKIAFETLNIKLPELVKTQTIEEQIEIFDYLSSMDDHHKKAYEIALNHLGSSFNIYRSNGFKEWKQSKTK